MSDKGDQIVEGGTLSTRENPHFSNLFAAVSGIISITLLVWRLTLNPESETV